MKLTEYFIKCYTVICIVLYSTPMTSCKHKMQNLVKERLHLSIGRLLILRSALAPVWKHIAANAVFVFQFTTTDIEGLLSKSTRIIRPVITVEKLAEMLVRLTLFEHLHKLKIVVISVWLFWARCRLLCHMRPFLKA